jgi:uncharacterized protein YbbK (DUF523 family)
VSSCLLGHVVRWDGGHKLEPFLIEELGPWVEWVPVCPEVEIGMGVPREPVRLVEGEGELRVVGERSGIDWSDRLRAWAQRRARELAALELCGYVLKSDSPSCGLARVPVWKPQGAPERRGRGLFAEALVAACDELPIEEESRLRDPRVRRSWIERVLRAARRGC